MATRTVVVETTHTPKVRWLLLLSFCSVASWESTHQGLAFHIMMGLFWLAMAVLLVVLRALRDARIIRQEKARADATARQAMRDDPIFKNQPVTWL